MLALLVALTLSQCTKDTDCKGERLCTAGTCVDRGDRPQREPSPLVAQLDAQRPGLLWPISSLAVGAVWTVVAVLLAASTGSDSFFAAGLAVGGGLTFAGLVSLATTLWARARVGLMMDEAQ